MIGQLIKERFKWGQTVQLTLNETKKEFEKSASVLGISKQEFIIKFYVRGMEKGGSQ